MARLTKAPPADFAPDFSQKQIRGAAVLTWRGTVQCQGRAVRLELAQQDGDATALRRLVWSLFVAAEQGDMSALQAYSVDRHKGRPLPVRGTSPPVFPPIDGDEPSA